ncbi:MAG: DUF1287 domain-containing protein [Abitibacteriaceae bacterium]|nr:DUF1287 domain-containing protein [Abditibacteriaceae bacterium]
MPAEFPSPEDTAQVITTRPKRSKSSTRRRVAIGLAAMLLVCALAVLQARTIWFLYWQHIAPRHAHALHPRTRTAARIVAGAKSQVGTHYNAAYTVISYPNGDVPRDHGACTDVVVRALRHAGYDLQQLIHEDITSDFNAYPHKWGLDHPDANIDHRRVPNQMCFFQRHGVSLTTVVSPYTLKQWQPGDFVYWSIGGKTLHTGVISDSCNNAGVPFVIHNGYICVEQDCLTNWKIIGHFRYPGTKGNGKPVLVQPQHHTTQTAKLGLHSMVVAA